MNEQVQDEIITIDKLALLLDKNPDLMKLNSKFPFKEFSKLRNQ